MQESSWKCKMPIRRVKNGNTNARCANRIASGEYCSRHAGNEGRPARTPSPASSVGSRQGVRCKYRGVRKKGNTNARCANKTASGEFCSRHAGNKGTRGRTPSPSSSVGSWRGSLSNAPCGALTSKRLPCKNKAFQGEPYCHKHLHDHPHGPNDHPRRPVHEARDYQQNQKSILAEEYRNEQPRRTIHDNPCRTVQQEGEHLEYQKSILADEEYLAPICRHCKRAMLSECNLCEACKLRALSLVHEVTDMDHSYISGPAIEERATINRREPPPTGYAQIARASDIRLTRILPKLKVVRPGDWGLPDVIPVDSNFRVWDRWWIVKQSRLGPNTGLGLFALEPIAEGENLLPYIGPEYDTATFNKILRLHPEINIYAFKYVDPFASPRRIVFIDGRTTHSNLAGYINSVHGDKLGREPNVHWHINEGDLANGRLPFLPMPLRLPHIMTVAIAPVQAGEELYSDYQWRAAQAYVDQLREANGLLPNDRSTRTKSRAI